MRTQGVNGVSALGFTKIAKPKSCESPNLPKQPQDKSCVLVTNIPLEINERHLSLTASLKWTRNSPPLPHPLNHTHAHTQWPESTSEPGVQSADFRV